MSSQILHGANCFTAVESDRNPAIQIHQNRDTIVDRGEINSGGAIVSSTAQGVVSRSDSEARVSEALDRHGDEARLWLQLMTCSSLIEAEIGRRLRDRFDFTQARFDLLAQLAQSKTSMALSAVSRQMMVSQSNITSLTNRLVESGHIRRTTSPTDRRVQIVSLTAHGRSAFRKMAAQRTKWVAELFANVPAKDRATLVKDLAGLKQSVAIAIATDRPRSR